MSIRHAQSNFRKLFVVAIGLTCAAALAIGLTIWWMRADEIADAFMDSNHLAVVLADQTANSIQSIDLVLTEIRNQEEIRRAQTPDDIDRVLRTEDTHKFLLERLSRLQQAEYISLTDKNGRLLNTTSQWPSPEIDLSDRPHFQHLKNNDDNSIYISDALVDRIKGTHVIFFSKRINGADNTFLGVVTVGVKLAYFQRIYESIASLPDQSFTLLHRDGTIIVRYPDQIVRSGEKIPAESPWYRLVLQDGGTYRAPGYFDTEARLMAVRPLHDYPLVVNVGVTETAALATWRIQAITLGAGALLFMLCVVFLLKAQSKQFHRLTTAKATIVEKAHELESSNAQLTTAQAQTNAALNNMSQGLILLDSSARLVVCNQRYLEMYGLTPEVIRSGCSLKELLDHRVATGTYYAHDAEKDLVEILAAASQGKVFGKIVRLRDGRIIRLSNHPIEGGGWVSTHEDVTAEMRAEERIAYTAYVDELTGLPNRKVFCQQLEQELKRVQRGERLALLYLDLDYLKQVNDTLGHLAGDKLLNGVADRLRGCVRDLDVVARLGGDEFAIIQKLLDHRPMPRRWPCESAMQFENHSISMVIKLRWTSALAFLWRQTMRPNSMN
jgi:GGDEF domain-containing protein/PAS domain-containing protein